MKRIIISITVVLYTILICACSNTNDYFIGKIENKRQIENDNIGNRYDYEIDFKLEDGTLYTMTVSKSEYLELSLGKTYKVYINKIIDEFEEVKGASKSD